MNPDYKNTFTADFSEFTALLKSLGLIETESKPINNNKPFTKKELNNTMSEYFDSLHSSKNTVHYNPVSSTVEKQNISYTPIPGLTKENIEITVDEVMNTFTVWTINLNFENPFIKNTYEPYLMENKKVLFSKTLLKNTIEIKVEVENGVLKIEQIQSKPEIKIV